MKAENFDRKFDAGESILEYLDLSQIQRGNNHENEEEIIALALPSSMILALKTESQRSNLPLNIMLKNWIEEKLSTPL
ncbi:CopG family transcriptional regulator [Synechocystis sp. LEGE 06083]|uniref:type II toxin-antitoxin system BrnA family antitoxin n=1 Tax=Synechocystis sp. LEGE 06083 TaxID=915336 RepID=UPI0018828CEA|nr:CopG family transcriptional regulator [Synechocystis sp. LEGE 06083]MBE9196996.1 CopG family transcriptional regulator [Synechocystis sp. LEGE 06083]